MSQYPSDQLKNIIEAALLVASRPLTLSQLEGLFAHAEHDEESPERDEIRESLKSLQEDYESRGIELVEVASGWRMQSREAMSPWIANLFQEKAPRYSRALLETLVLVAYRQPITRGEIEDVRGVAVSSNIVKTLIEREWVKVVGHRDVPGRPALLGTTREFLDYFNLKKIGDLPTLSEIKSLDEIAPELAQEVAMLDATLAPDSEAGESGSDELEDSSQAMAAAGEAGSDNDFEDDADDSDYIEDDLDDDDLDDADNSGRVDVKSVDIESVDVELAPEASSDEAEIVGEEVDGEEIDGEKLDDEEMVAVAEATMDAMATGIRPESELLH